MSSHPYAQLTEQIADLTQREQVPGLALAVSRAGELEYFHGFGYRDLEHKLPVTPDTVFGIAQIVRVLQMGRLLAEGTPEEIRNNPEVITAYLGEEVS